MNPEKESISLLGVTRSQAKMIEYNIPVEHRIRIYQNPEKLFALTLGILGDVAAEINRGEISEENFREKLSILFFSAHFFDAFLNSQLNTKLDDYLAIIGASTYYLCNLPGSANILVNRIERGCPDLGGDGLEKLLVWLLKSKYSEQIGLIDGQFSEWINQIVLNFRIFSTSGDNIEEIVELSKIIRKISYIQGTPRQLLIGDLVCAIISKKIENSNWIALPKYSNLNKDVWENIFKRESFIKELWPAQQIIGHENIFNGESAVIQMPTSAGKTKAIELIIRSSFLSNRTELVVVIAPFRSLCNEIRNSMFRSFQGEKISVVELSDTLQIDFFIENIFGHKQIVVVTPEKLLYSIRHYPEIVEKLGLIIFDEGHQFDNGTRGVTYELLLTSLKSKLKKEAQKVLLSAVVSNAKSIAMWLNDSSKTIEGSTLSPTYKTIGFVSWKDVLGRIEFVVNNNIEKGEYFVPRVIESIHLNKLPQEKKDRIFPQKADGKEIALYLGLKLCPNGGVAIFCGQKASVIKLCKVLVSIVERNVTLPIPRDFSTRSEIEKLYFLHSMNLGPKAFETICAQYGVFSHHNNTPQGLRVAIEYAMHNDQIRFVICTSTLAQGVNLPIRYLIVTSVYQGGERIKVRDFHNLIGRTGRAGMYTEGSIIFADPNVFDNKLTINQSWRWKLVKVLLEPTNSEPCGSSILDLFNPIFSTDERENIRLDTIEFVKSYLDNPEILEEFAFDISNSFGDKDYPFAFVHNQLRYKTKIISSIESFLLAFWDDGEEPFSSDRVNHLVEGTLAYFISDNQVRTNIQTLFLLIAQNIIERNIDPVRRKIFGKTLFGLFDNLYIEEWIHNHKEELEFCDNSFDLLGLIWPLLIKYISNSTFTRYSDQEKLLEIAKQWINGVSYCELLADVKRQNAKLRWGKKFRKIEISNIVDLCDNGFSYEGSMLIGSMIEITDIVDFNNPRSLLFQLKELQKRLKYGLPSYSSIVTYEAGFTDRVIAQDIINSFDIDVDSKRDLKKALRKDVQLLINVINKYPSYYISTMNQLLKLS